MKIEPMKNEQGQVTGFVVEGSAPFRMVMASPDGGPLRAVMQGDEKIDGGMWATAVEFNSENAPPATAFQNMKPPEPVPSRYFAERLEHEFYVPTGEKALRVGASNPTVVAVLQHGTLSSGSRDIANAIERWGGEWAEHARRECAELIVKLRADLDEANAYATRVREAYDRLTDHHNAVLAKYEKLGQERDRIAEELNAYRGPDPELAPIRMGERAKGTPEPRDTVQPPPRWVPVYDRPDGTKIVGWLAGGPC